MANGAPNEVFPLAEMSRGIRLLTLVLLALPGLLLVVGLGGAPILVPVAAFVAAVYAAVWLWMRPQAFTVRHGGLEIVWPLRRRRIEPTAIAAVERITLAQLREEFGFVLRVGAGGLWGGFGMLWSSKGHHLDFYVSRLDGWVLVRRHGARPLLISPEQPDRLVERLRA